MNEHKLYQSLVKDLDKVCLSLIESHKLPFDKNSESLSSPLIRWLDFVSRYIPPQERAVQLSSHLKEKLQNNLPTQAITSFEFFMKKSVKGEDLNPFQSKGFLLHNDTSADEKHKRTDLLFADWGILHSHLSNEIKSGQYFSTRSDWLLFSMVFGDVIFCIDILPHSEKDLFSKGELLEILYKNWPLLFEKYEIKGIVSNQNWIDSERSELRRVGISSHYSICGKVFAPLGGGLTSAAIPVRVMNMIQRVRYGVRCIASMIENPKSVFSQNRTKFSSYELGISPRGLCISDVYNDIAYVLPRDELENEPLALLHDLILPTWVFLKK